MVAAEFAAGLSSFKAMFDIAKGLKDINDAAARNAAVIELQEKILSAQGQQTALVERISALEKEVAGFETWEAEKQRYELKEIGERRAFAYILKPSEAGSEPVHGICAACYERGTKSILQDNGEMLVSKHAYACPNCGFKLKTQGELPWSRQTGQIE